MGVVYLATDPMLNRQVAIKTVDLGVDDPAEREFLRARLLRDARAAAVLKHPNIVAVHDVFEEGASAYVVMEYVEGDSLAALLKSNPLPAVDMILKVLGQMAAALDYTHSRDVIHRDIKPANVMIDAAGSARIMDFGIARIADTRTSTPTGMVVGTAEYMAPEQIRGEELDGRADQFALAVVAYQMMTGSTLFGPQTLVSLTYKIVNEPPPPPTTRNAALPRAVDAVIAKALAKSPAERFPNCTEFALALSQAFTDTTTTRLTVPPQPPARSRSALWAAVLAVVALGGAFAVWRPWSHPAPPPAPVAETHIPVPTVEPAKPVPVENQTPPPAVPKSSRPATHLPEPPAAKAASTPPEVTPPEPVEDAEVLPPPPEPKAAAASTPFEVAMKHGQELMKNRDFAGALQAFSRAVELRPKGPLAYLNLGAAQQNLQQNEAAIQSYTQTIRLAPDNALAYAERGVCLVRLHRDPDALIDFQRALEIKPGLPIALNGRGGVAFRRQQYRLALADYDAAIKGNPRMAQAYANRAQARQAVGDSRGAAEDRRREADLRKK